MEAKEDIEEDVKNIKQDIKETKRKITNLKKLLGTQEWKDKVEELKRVRSDMKGLDNLLGKIRDKLTDELLDKDCYGSNQRATKLVSNSIKKVTKDKLNEYVKKKIAERLKEIIINSQEFKPLEDKREELSDKEDRLDVYDEGYGDFTKSHLKELKEELEELEDNLKQTQEELANYDKNKAKEMAKMKAIAKEVTDTLIEKVKAPKVRLKGINDVDTTEIAEDIFKLPETKKLMDKVKKNVFKGKEAKLVVLLV